MEKLFKSLDTLNIQIEIRNFKLNEFKLSLTNWESNFKSIFEKFLIRSYEFD